MTRPPSPPAPSLPLHAVRGAPSAGVDPAGLLPPLDPGVADAGGSDDPRHPRGAVARLARALDARSILDRSRWLRLRDEADRWEE